MSKDTPSTSDGCCGWFSLIVAGILLLSTLGRFFGCGSSSSDITPNRGYMTLKDDNLMTTILIKKGYGESLSENEQQFLDAVKAGTFGKPYDDRPDKEHDGAGR